MIRLEKISCFYKLIDRAFMCRNFKLISSHTKYLRIQQKKKKGNFRISLRFRCGF